MIDSQKERLIPLAEAAVQVPGRRPGQYGRRLHFVPVDRPRRPRCAARVDGLRRDALTTAEAIQRFFEGVTEARRSGRPAPTSDAPDGPDGGPEATRQ